MTQNCQYGTHRVIEPANVLPQTANKIDNSLPIRSNELLVEVDTLNIDSASFTQMKKACDGDLKKVGEMIQGIVAPAVTIVPKSRASDEKRFGRGDCPRTTVCGTTSTAACRADGGAVPGVQSRTRRLDRGVTSW